MIINIEVLENEGSGYIKVTKWEITDKYGNRKRTLLKTTYGT